MSARFIFTGLDELRAELRKLPTHLAGEASHIIEGAANGAGVAIRSGYAGHRVTGNLQDHVDVERRESGQFGAAYRVKSTAKHAQIFERGTEARHYVTRNGVQHLTGRMPPHPVFIPAMVKARRGMWNQLRDLLTRTGLQVNGEP